MADQKLQVITAVVGLDTIDGTQKAQAVSKMKALPDDDVELLAPKQYVADKNLNELGKWVLGFIGN